MRELARRRYSNGSLKYKTKQSIVNIRCVINTSSATKLIFRCVIIKSNTTFRRIKILILNVDISKNQNQFCSCESKDEPTTEHFTHLINVLQVCK